jgi:hypothetical protein
MRRRFLPVMTSTRGSVGRLVSLLTAGIGFVIIATEADALNPLKRGHGRHDLP